MRKFIAVFGGAFNPVTIGHLSLAEELTNEYDIEKVLFLPVSDMYEKNELISSFHRVNMLKEVCKTNEKFEVSEVETNSKALLHTIDSLEIIQKSYPQNTLLFVMGSDNLRKIHTWQSFNSLMGNYQFAVINRDGDDTKKIVEESQALRPYIDRFLHFEHSIRNDANSSYIRELIKKNKSIRYLVADEVYKYIKENKIYE